MPGSLESPFFPEPAFVRNFEAHIFRELRVIFFLTGKHSKKRNDQKVEELVKRGKKHLRTKMSHFEARLASQSLSRIPGTIALKFFFRNKLFDCSMLFI